jgi:hypothetical protein
VEGLKDEADRAAPESGEALLAHLVKAPTFE